jgi:hypothetical protein
MFHKEIEFSAQEDYFSLKEDYPVPIKLNIPEWYKKLNHSIDNLTVKGCMPFLDSLTSGYLLKMPQDFNVRHNVINEKGEKDSFQTFGLHDMSPILIAKQINLNSGIDVHPVRQLMGSSFIEKNKNLPFYKILNPWKIKTPKGYSTLFMQPVHRESVFTILPGLVDTDTYSAPVNFPFVLNDVNFEGLIPKGTPIAQVIPIKRENWTMEFGEEKELREQVKISQSLSTTFFDRYKTMFRQVKTYNKINFNCCT